MQPIDALSWNIGFFHSYPRSVCEGVSDEQLRWQPHEHPNSILFTIWHPLSAEDAAVSRWSGRDQVLDSGGWRARLTLPDNWPPSWELTRAHIAALDLDIGTLLDYGEAVGEATLAYLGGLTESDAAEAVEIPWAQRFYPKFGTGTRLDLVGYFSIGHLAAHLGEVQYIKGLAGLRGTAI